MESLSLVTAPVSQPESTVSQSSSTQVSTDTLQAQPIKINLKPEPPLSTSVQRPRKTQDDRQVDKEQIGLRCLYELPQDATTQTNKIDVDIVAVHGLGANPDASWIDRDSKVNWLEDKDMLPNKLPNSRILRYGYESKWFGQDAVKTRLQNIAELLLHFLRSDDDREQNPTRPLIFVCHCFGGLIVEKALCIARTNKKSWPNIFKACQGIVLMGTPHRGTGGLTAQQILSRVIDANIQAERITQSYLDSSNDTLVELVSNFTKLIRDDKVRDRLPIVCFFETISTDVSVILKKVKLDNEPMKEFVVDETSASLEGCESFGLPLNHFQLNKFSGPRDGLYGAVSSVIVNMFKQISTLPEKSKNVVKAQSQFQQPTIPVIPQQLTILAGKKPVTVPVRNSTVRRPISYRPPLSVPPFDRDKNFQGREEILNAITKKFKQRERNRIVLHGTIGIGKSHIANEYAHRYSEITPNSMVFWIPARTSVEFVRAYIKLGKELRIPGMEDPGKDPLDLVKAYLSEETERSWLMVIDGAENLDMDLSPQKSVGVGKVRRRKMMMDCLPSGPLGVILATTCDRVMARELINKQSGEILEVNTFTQEEGLSLVRKKLGSERIPDFQVFELLDIIHSLPIALAQAVAYLVHSPNTTVNEYLISLTTNTSSSTITKSGLSIRSDGLPKSHLATIATTKVSFKHIQNTNSRCALLSEIASMFDFQNIPISLLRHFDEKVDEFRDILIDFALVNVPTDRAQVTMNRLVQSSIKDLAIDKSSLSSEILMILSQSFPAVRSGNPGFSQSCETLLPFAQATLELGSSPTTNRGLDHRATLLINVARYNAHLNKYDSAIDALKEAIQLREKELGKDSEAVAETKLILEDIQRKIKAPITSPTTARKQIPPKLNGCLELARSAINLKQQKEAEKELIKQLETLKTQGQDTSKEAIEIEDSLAMLYDATGRHAESITVHQKVLDWCKTKYGTNGANDLHTYRQIYKIALNQDLQGKYQEAERNYHEALTGTSKCLGEDHPEVSRIYTNLATLSALQNNPDSALNLFTKAINLQSQNPGPQHPDSLMTKHNFAVFLQSQNRLDHAGNLLEEVLEQQERVLGSEHPDVLRCAGNLAKNFWLKGEDEVAESIWGRVLEGQIRVWGGEHAETRATREMIEAARN